MYRCKSYSEIEGFSVLPMKGWLAKKKDLEFLLFHFYRETEGLGGNETSLTDDHEGPNNFKY